MAPVIVLPLLSHWYVVVSTTGSKVGADRCRSLPTLPLPEIVTGVATAGGSTTTTSRQGEAPRTCPLACRAVTRHCAVPAAIADVGAHDVPRVGTVSAMSVVDPGLRRSKR